MLYATLQPPYHAAPPTASPPIEPYPQPMGAMAHIVSYIERTGRISSLSFPTFSLALSYCRTVKGGRVVQGGSDEPQSLTVAYIAPGVRTLAPPSTPCDQVPEGTYSMCSCGKHTTRQRTLCYLCRRYR